MRALLVVAAAMVIAAPRFAGAQSDPVEIAFDECPGSPGAVPHRIDECNSNTGQAMSLVGSFIAPQDLDNFVGLSATVLIGRHNESLPAWWGLFPGGCRGNRVTVHGSVGKPNVCADPIVGSGSSLVLDEIDPGDPGGPTFLRVRLDLFVGASEAHTLQAGVKYQAFTLNVARAQSVGPDACAGCCEGVCIFLEQITLAPLGAPEMVLRNTVSPAVAFWQSAGIFTDPDECIGGDCPVPVRRSTWGELKSLYR